MQKLTFTLVAALFLASAAVQVSAAPALSVLGKDYTFPNKIDVLPSRLSDFKDLQINFFETSDGAKLAYWEAAPQPPCQP